MIEPVANGAPVCLVLTVEPDGDGWRVSLGEVGTIPARMRVSAEAVARVRATCERLDQVPSVLVPGHDAARTRVEESAGRALSIVLDSAELSRRLARLLSGSRFRSTLVIDAPTPELRALPWELLAGGPSEPPLVVCEQVAIVRRLPGPPAERRSTGRRMRVLVWCPTPEDPPCRDLLSRLVASAVRARAEVVALDPMLARLPPPAPGCADVLHIVCHGRMVEDGTALKIGEGAMSPGTSAHLLAPGLAEVAVVVLDVCEGGAATRDQLEGLAGRLVHAGARVVVAPRAPAAVPMLAALADGLLQSLLLGRQVSAAVEDGRRTVRSLAHPSPAMRWTNLSAFVADVEAALTRVVDPGWRPRTWPRPDVDAAEVLDRAKALGSPEGHIGVEHVARALSSSSGGGPVTYFLRRLILKAGPEPWAALAMSRVRVPDVPPDETGTPRLNAVGAQLPEGFSLEQLAMALVSDAGDGLGLILPLERSRTGPRRPEQSATWGDGATTPELARPRREHDGLEVLWGPRDGEMLTLAVGSKIGRWPGSADCALHPGAPSTDRALSRHHLTWLGGGRIAVVRPVVDRSSAERRPVSPGEYTFAPGTVLELAPGTWLRVCGPEDLRRD